VILTSKIRMCTVSSRFVFLIIIIISNLSDDRSKASFKTIHPLNAIYSFLFQMRVSSPVPRSSSSFLRLLSRPLVTSICPFIFPSTTCFRRQFLRKM
jgi:hypothetical protein